MIRRLIILLLIVGCAPKTTTNYYIGMSEQEFINNNPNLVKLEIKTDIGSGFWITFDEVEKTDTSGVLPYFYMEEKVGFITWLSFGKMDSFDYIFNPETDTLTKVKYGIIKVD